MRGGIGTGGEIISLLRLLLLSSKLVELKKLSTPCLPVSFAAADGKSRSPLDEVCNDKDDDDEK